MNRRIIGGVLLGLGIVLLLAGLVLMFVIVPGMKQFPDDVDTTRTYRSVEADGSPGTMEVLLDPAAFEFMRDFEVDLERHFKTVDTDGDLALVDETKTLSSQEQTLQQVRYHYVIDRKTMEAAEDYPDDWEGKEGLWERKGLVMGWPIGTEEKGYTGWSEDYRDTVELKFEEKVEYDRADGMETYLFTASRPPEPIHPDAVAAMGLPLELDKELLIGLIEESDVSALVKTALPTVLGDWPEDTVPLAYYYEYEGWYWVEPTSGVLIDTRKHELRKVTLADEVLELAPMLANLPEEQRAASRVPVYDLTYQATDQSVEDAKQDAEDAKGKLELYGMIIPLLAIGIGLILVIIGGFLVARKPAAATAEAPG